MPEINPLTNDQILLKKIAENTGSDYETGDVSEINPLTIDQIFLKEIAANTIGQSGDITELKEKVADNTAAIEAIENEYGAKNVLPIRIERVKSLNTSGTWNGNTFTRNGIEFACTVNDSGYVTKIMVSSAGATTDTLFRFEDVTSAIHDILQDGVTYAMNGCPSGGSASTYRLTYTNNVDADYNDFGNGVDLEVFPSSYTDTVIGIMIKAGAVMSNIEFYPMIRDARITDPTYVPYAMTNRELTESINGRELTSHDYQVTFTVNGYVSPFSAIYDDSLVSAADVAEYGTPVSGCVWLASGFPCSPIWLSKRNDGGFNVKATAYTSGTLTITVMFLKM